jgi:ferredoxin
MLFRPLLETLGFDLRRIQFTWISAAEGRKFQQTITEFTALTRELGPANYLKTSGAAPELERSKPPRPQYAENAELKVRQRASELLASGQVAVVIGYDRRGTPLFVTDPAGAGALAVNENCHANLAVYVKRKEVRALGRAAPSFQDLDALLSHEPEVRMAYWADEFDRCVKCYACRQVCPMCYCEQCLVEKNRPQVIDSSPTLMGNFAWHITRAFHLASRCVGCGECTRACPAGINLTLLNKTLAKASLDHFGYRAGAERGAQPLIGIYSLQDKEDFIR